MNRAHAPNPRPYWHVDGKWSAGLLLLFVLGPTLLLYSLVQVTAEKPAVDTLTMALALSFSRQGLDDETEIAEMPQRLRASPGGSFQPIPGLRIVIHEQDIAGLSPRQARLSFFRQLAEPLYRQGPEGLIALADDPEMRKSMAGGAGPLGILSLQTHQSLQRALVVFGIVCLVLLVPLVWFSHRFGRLGSPGCVLFAASVPGTILATIIASTAGQASRTPPPDEAGMTGMAGYLASHVLPPLAQVMSRSYVIFLALGLGLMLLALLSNFIWWLTHRDRPGTEGHPTAAQPVA